MLSIRHTSRFALTSMALVVLAACKEDAPSSPAVQTVFVSPPIQREVTGRDGFSGRFEATDAVDIRARVGGYIDQVAFRDGAFVKKGDLLFLIDPRPYQAALTQSEGRLADARSRQQLADIELGRAKRLVSSGAIATSVLDQRTQEQQAAQAAVMTATGALARARLDLSFTEIRAPMSGRISRKLVSQGNLIAGGDANATLLTTIVSIDPIDIYFDIDEETYLRYGRLAADGKRQSADNLGSEVRIALPGETGAPRLGKLDFVENRLDRSTGTLRGRARVANAEHTLNPGQFGRVELISEAPHSALLVPDAALSTDATRRVLSIVDKDDTVVVRPVKLGRLFGKLREITEGLEAGDRVIVSGLQRAQAGEKVAVQLQPIDEGVAAVAGVK
jgi:multidrug efflux system membrane fusion protein